MPALFTYRRVVNVTLFLVYLLVLLGGATRVFDAGTSCPDWPHCYGVWWPWPESVVPGGYIYEGRHFIWFQVALEWVHRLTAMIVGVSVLGMIGYSFRRPKGEWLPLGAMTVLLAVQGLLGGLTVLKANAPWSVAVHLATAMLFFASMLWLRREVASKGVKTPPRAPDFVKFYVGALVALVWVLMTVGAFVSSSHAGGVCGGLFSCGGQWFPEDLQQHSHMLHRYLALAVVVLSGVYIGLAKRKAPALRRGAVALHLMVWGQVCLGILTLYSFSDYPTFYEALSIAHLGWGTLVFMIAVGNVLYLVYGESGRAHGASYAMAQSDAEMSLRRRKSVRKRRK
jgi:cytochrome c oxidase assembly protein subunit 15